MFIDYVEVTVVGGSGGAGAEAFRREKGVARGGPSGGDGGDGGDVVLVADDQLSTLLDFQYRDQYRAERGMHGEGSNRTGRSGGDLILRIPPGTVVRDSDTGEQLGELLNAGDQLLVARGGRGGRGNARFATATNRAPRKWESGQEGEERRISLELKLIAEVGLVGQPNAGKSTLLATLSAAQPKIADYPFTTLEPGLGVVQLSSLRSFVMADIPGIIEGAHEGKGLGLRFLRHIERTRTLAFVIPLDAENGQAEYKLLREELHAYSPALAGKPHCIIHSKADLLGPDEEEPRLNAPDAWEQFTVSAVSGRGREELVEGLWRRVRDQVEKAAEDEPEPDAWRP